MEQGWVELEWIEPGWVEPEWVEPRWVGRGGKLEGKEASGRYMET